MSPKNGRLSDDDGIRGSFLFGAADVHRHWTDAKVATNVRDLFSGRW